MVSPQAPDFGDLLARLTRELRLRDLPFMLIGGQAVLVHGRPRLTEDIDVTLGVGPTHLPEVRSACEALGLEILPTAEDLVIHKLFAGRATDWEDAVGIVRRKGHEIDWEYVERWAREFAAVPGRERMPEEVLRLRREAD